eukprot:Seg1450.12 transcript_id=Seg1450.12/GoldUCD/mRNA.D3Y31 product="RILP-like protein-like" protein_id=Seg1450.12/GoldUCD/D3Y31
MDDFTVADVYEHAAKIGQDIEQLIRDYGEDSVEELMPKIVFTLEQLEGLAERKQKDVGTISDLVAEKERLLIECKKEAAIKRQLEEKVDYLEDLMNEDTNNLQKTITMLKQENELLKSEVEELDEEMTTQRTTALPGDVNLMVKMKATIDAQRDQIREVNQENERHKTEIEALNEQSNRLTEINERLRLYNGKLQDRLAKAVEDKVQAEATLASVKIANEDERNEADVQDGKKVEAQSLYWETGVGRREKKEEEVLAGSAMQVVGEVDTTKELPVRSEAPAHGELHASGEINSGSKVPVGSDVSVQREMHPGSEVHAGSELHAGSEVYAGREVHTDSKVNEIKGVEDKKSGEKGLQKTPSIAQEAEEDDFVVVPRASSTISKADKRPSSGDKRITKKGIREAAGNNNNNNNNDNAESNVAGNDDKQTEVKGTTKVREREGANETPRPKKDPNRPRYTLAEMQQVLEERNRFKERVGILEDVLEAYVPAYAHVSIS